MDSKFEFLKIKYLQYIFGVKNIVRSPFKEQKPLPNQVVIKCNQGYTLNIHKYSIGLFCESIHNIISEEYFNSKLPNYQETPIHLEIPYNFLDAHRLIEYFTELRIPESTVLEKILMVEIYNFINPNPKHSGSIRRFVKDLCSTLPNSFENIEQECLNREMNILVLSDLASILKTLFVNN